MLHPGESEVGSISARSHSVAWKTWNPFFEIWVLVLGWNMKKDEGGFFIEATLTSARQSAGEEDLRTRFDHCLHCLPHTPMSISKPNWSFPYCHDKWKLWCRKFLTCSLMVPYTPPSKLEIPIPNPWLIESFSEQWPVHMEHRKGCTTNSPPLWG